VDNTYPRAIYRDGGTDLVWGKPIQTSAVNSEDEEAAMLADGWRLSPAAPEATDPEPRADAPRKVRTNDGRA
jgi:hypothetical protein